MSPDTFPTHSPPSPDSARARLLDAAERLFGEQGIPHTSVRQLTTQAQVNLSAVNYYFGSKEGLVEAVLARRAEPINKRREALLETCIREANGAPPPIESVLNAFITPAFTLFDSHPAFLKFLARLWQEPDASFRNVMLRQFAAVARRFMAVLHSSLPGLPMSDLWVRFSFCVGGMLHTFTSHREAVGFFEIPGIDTSAEALAQQWVRFAAGGLRAAPIECPSVASTENAL